MSDRKKRRSDGAAAGLFPATELPVHVRPARRWRAWSLIYFTWPVYCTQWLLAVLRRPFSFRATPTGRRALPTSAVLPQLLMAGTLIPAAVFGLWSGRADAICAAAFACLQVLPVGVVLTVASGRGASADDAAMARISRRAPQGRSS